MSAELLQILRMLYLRFDVLGQVVLYQEVGLQDRKRWVAPLRNKRFDEFVYLLRLREFENSLNSHGRVGGPREVLTMLRGSTKRKRPLSWPFSDVQTASSAGQVSHRRCSRRISCTPRAACQC